MDPAGCTQTLGYDNTIPTWDQYWAGKHDPDAVRPARLRHGRRRRRRADLRLRRSDAARPQPDARHLPVLGRRASTATKDRTGTQSEADQEVPRQVRPSAATSRSTSPARRRTSPTSTRPNGDAAFWRGVRAGDDPDARSALEAAGERPAFAWVTATPHGGESAGAESITRSMYELLARTDCENARRLKNLDVFYQPVRNPDGRDGVTRTSAFGFDPNRDFGTQNQIENKLMLPEINKYPGVFFIDAHQQGSGVLLPAQRGPGPPRDLRLLAGLHPERDRPGAAAGVQRPVRAVPELQLRTTCSRRSTATRCPR